MRPPSALLAAVVSAWLSGCAMEPVAVTSKNGGGSQSETAFSINRHGDTARVTIAYNDGTTQSAITYTATTRVATAGATHLGWSHSADFGANWTYGGRVQGNDDWPILWGDPGIGHSVRDQRYVYIVSLAIPKAKLDTAPGGQISGAVNAYIGGACVARSTDSGQTFSLYQCVQTKEFDSKGDFYDGGNVASDGKGNIYAAWVNADTNAIHVWRAVGEGGTFQKLANPFGSRTMVSHARLRVNLDNDDLFVMAMDDNGELLIARWNGSSWAAVRQTNMYAVGYPCIASNGANCTSADTVLRTGPQFSFDIGAFGKTNDHIRMMFTRRSSVNGRLYIAGAGCNLDDQNCQYIPEWGTGEGGADKVTSSYNPLVRAYRSAAMANNGEPSLWMGSHATYHPGSGRVGYGMGGAGMREDAANQDVFFYIPVFQLPNRILCADLRGYWGDYDDLQALGPVGQRSNVFARTFTDSSQGCDYRWQFTSQHVHVGFTGQ